jgi:hypothetical protein
MNQHVNNTRQGSIDVTFQGITRYANITTIHKATREANTGETFPQFTTDFWETKTQIGYKRWRL